MKKRDKFHARKSDAKNMENHPKWVPKGVKNHPKSIKNEVQKSDDFWKGFSRKARWPRGTKGRLKEGKPPEENQQKGRLT